MIPLFTDELRNKYTNLINNNLDAFPMHNPESFERLIEALKSITEPNESHFVASDFRGRIEEIKEWVTQPAKCAQNCPEAFGRLAFELVIRKIQNLSQLTQEEKDNYLELQSAKKLEEEQAEVDYQTKIALQLQPLEAELITLAKDIYESEQMGDYYNHSIVNNWILTHNLSDNCERELNKRIRECIKGIKLTENFEQLIQQIKEVLL